MRAAEARNCSTDIAWAWAAEVVASDVVHKATARPMAKARFLISSVSVGARVFRACFRAGRMTGQTPPGQQDRACRPVMGRAAAK